VPDYQWGPRAMGDGKIEICTKGKSFSQVATAYLWGQGGKRKGMGVQGADDPPGKLFKVDGVDYGGALTHRKIRREREAVGGQIEVNFFALL